MMARAVPYEVRITDLPEFTDRLTQAFEAGKREGAAAERDRISQVLADPESEWRFTGPALDYFADLLRGDPS